MQADGSNPENPFRLLVCDADALIQVICADQIELLKKLEKSMEFERLSPRRLRMRSRIRRTGEPRSSAPLFKRLSIPMC